MPRIPFIEARFRPSTKTVDEIEAHLRRHLRELREAEERRKEEAAMAAPEQLRHELPSMPLWALDLPQHDKEKIRRCAALLVQRRKATDGLSHLKREDRERLAVLRDGVEFIEIGLEHRADELAAALHAEMPWMAPATEIVWHAMRRAAKSADGALRFPPLLLDGPPGIGKSVWARRLGELLRMPTAIIEATNENASFGVAGVQRGWGTAMPGKPLETILRSLVGNPLVIVDEVEKAGNATSKRGQTFGLAEALLPLLEPASSRHWECPYFRVRFDMSWIGWILTSNRQALLPEPLLSRCRVVRLSALDTEQLTSFARREAMRRELSVPAQDAIVEAIARSVASEQNLSLRSVIRLLERAAILQEHPLLH